MIDRNESFELTSINSARQRLAAVRSGASGYFDGFELMATTSGANKERRLLPPVTISFSHNCNKSIHLLPLSKNQEGSSLTTRSVNNSVVIDGFLFFLL